MQRDEGAVDRQEAEVPDSFREILSKGNLRPGTHRDPVVRCVPFKWTDRRKRKGYKRAGWLVEWREPGGKRFRKNFLDATKAKLFTSQKQAEVLNAQRAARYVQTRLTDAQLDEVEGAFARLGDRYTLTQAIDYFFAHYQEANFKISLGDAALAFRGAMEGVIRDRTLIQLKSTLSQFETFTENPDLHEITSTDVERFLKNLRARDGASQASPKTWNNYRADLHLFFQWCTQKPRRWIVANPATEVCRLRVETAHVEVLSLQRATALLDYVAGFKAGKYVWYFALALFAGIRPGGELEKLALHKELVDFKNRVIRLSGAISKTGKARQIKLRSNLYEWLTRYPGEIFPTNADRELKAIRKRFGLTHDVLRHTFCSAHVMAFGSFAETALESGNSESIIRNFYLNTVAQDEARAFWIIAPEEALEGKVVRLA
jgi:hypothetical protein